MTDQATDALANYLIATNSFTLLLRCSIETNWVLYLVLYLLGQLCIYSLAFPRLHVVGPKQPKASSGYWQL